MPEVLHHRVLRLLWVLSSIGGWAAFAWVVMHG